MKRIILTFCLVALALQAQAETPRQFAERFYRAYFRWEIRGEPNTSERHRISAYFSAEVLQLFRVVERQRTQEREGILRKYPNPNDPNRSRKPIWSKEGDPFSNTYEGISTFAIGRAIIRKGLITVPAHLEYLSGGHAYAWTDVLILDRAGDSWVVSDIQFKHSGTLMSNLKDKIAREEPYLQSLLK